MRKSCTGVFLIALSGISLAARASVDLPGLYDGRSVAMGGTGVAFIEGGTSMYLNPATLSGVRSYALTGDFSLTLPELTGPWGGPPSTKTGRTPFPLFLAGGAYRLSPSLVVGLGAYPTVGFGATYKNPPAALGADRLEMIIAQFEVSPAIAYSVSERLSFGLGYRVTYTTESLHLAVPTPAGPPVLMDSSLSGANFSGVHVGAYTVPAERWRFGLSYLSKTSTDLTGTTTLPGLPEQTTTSNFKSPHRFKVEVAHQPMSRLLVALQVKYLLYSDSNDKLVTRVGEMPPTEQVLDWKNVLAGALGLEYEVAPGFPVRLGYALSQSSVPAERASPFLPPPSLLHSVHAGFGYRTGNLALDLGGYDTWGSATVEGSAPNFVSPGEYGINSIIMAASASYRPLL